MDYRTFRRGAARFSAVIVGIIFAAITLVAWAYFIANVLGVTGDAIQPFMVPWVIFIIFVFWWLQQMAIAFTPYEIEEVLLEMQRDLRQQLRDVPYPRRGPDA